MGLFSSKSSSSQQTTINTQNVGASEGSIAATDGATVNVLDAGAIESAFDFSSETAARSLEEAFRFASETLGVIKNTVSASQASADKTLSEALASKDEAQSGGAERLLQFGGLALVGIVLLAYIQRG